MAESPEEIHDSMNSTQAGSRIGFAFMSFLTGQTVSMIGSYFGGMALSILILEKTGSAAAMSLNAILSMLPTLLLGPAAGVVLDRVNRKRILIASDILKGIFTLGVGWLIHAGRFTIYHAYAWSIITSLFTVLYDPGVMAFIPALVAPRHLQRANALQALSRNVAMVVAPALAGIAIAKFGPWFALTTNAAAFWFAAACISIARTRYEEKVVKTGRPRFSEIKEGLEFFRRSQLAFTLLMTTVLVNACSQPAGMALQVHVLQVLKGDATVIGLAHSMWAGASILSSFVIASWGKRFRLGQTLLLGVAGSGLSFVLVSLLPWLKAIPVAYAIGGLAGPAVQVPVHTLYQDITPDDVRGRVFALRVSLSQVLSPLSYAVSGILLDVLGSRMVFAGLGLTLIATSLTIRALGRLRDV